MLFLAFIKSFCINIIIATIIFIMMLINNIIVKKSLKKEFVKISNILDSKNAGRTISFLKNIPKIMLITSGKYWNINITSFVYKIIRNRGIANLKYFLSILNII
jgi:hypothetical protein